MNKQDRAEFLTIIAALAATFRTEATEAMLAGYWTALDDLPLDRVKKAAAKAMRTSKFMPVVAELRELAGVMLPAHRAILAWEAFRRAVSSQGYYISIDFDDPVINATVRNLGGWMPLLDRMESDDEKWVRKDFERVYVALTDSGVSAEQALPLLGFHEQHNRLNGYGDQVPPPTKMLTGLPPHAEGVVSLPDHTQYAHSKQLTHT